MPSVLLVTLFQQCQNVYLLHFLIHYRSSWDSAAFSTHFKPRGKFMCTRQQEGSRPSWGHGQTRDEDDAAAIKKKGEEDSSLPPRDPPHVSGSSATTTRAITRTMGTGTARHSHPHIIHISSMNVTDIQLLSVPHAGPLTRTHNSVTSPKPQLAAH